MEGIWPPAFLLQSASDQTPVMRIKRHHVLYFRKFPADVQCNGFRGTFRCEWYGRPSLFALLTFRCQRVRTLRRDDGALCGIWKPQALPYYGDQGEIIINDRHLRVQIGRRQTLTVTDGDEVVLSGVYGRKKPHLKLLRVVEGIEAILGFVFIETVDLHDFITTD
jgi:hypothetical protein